MVRMAPLVSNRLCGELQQAITALAWSPDGEFLVITCAGGELLPRRGAGCPGRGIPSILIKLKKHNNIPHPILTEYFEY